MGWSCGRSGVVRGTATLVIALVLLATMGAHAAPVTAEEPEIILTGPPVRLLLPAIDIDAEVGAFALNEDLTMPVPQRAALVAWYDFSAQAGETGNVVLAGHRDWQREKGVFYNLGTLQEEDEVWLQDGATNWYLYRVVWTVSLADDGAPVGDIVGRTDVPSVTLITCSGTFDRSAGRYVERRIVRAEFVHVVPAQISPAPEAEPVPDAEPAAEP